MDVRVTSIDPLSQSIKAAMIGVFLHVVHGNIEQRGTGIENESEWSNATVHYDWTGPAEEKWSTSKGGRFFQHFSGWIQPIHLVSDRNFREFWLNRSRPTLSTLLNRQTIYHYIFNF